MFGNQGALWGNAMTWWDHQTGSVWSQPLGEAIMGPLTGEALELLSSQLTRWGTWRSDHPGTLALDAPAGRSGFDPRTMTIVLDFGDEAAVYPFSELAAGGPANDVVAGVPVAVVVDPANEERWKVFHRRAGGRLLDLSVSNGRVVDQETGSVWDMSNGMATSGPLEGEIMDQLPAFTAFEDDAATFWPDARVWEP